MEGNGRGEREGGREEIRIFQFTLQMALGQQSVNYHTIVNSFRGGESDWCVLQEVVMFRDTHNHNQSQNTQSH